MTTTQNRQPTLAPECEVPCPSCGADTDEVCLTRDGRVNRNPHTARIRAWVAMREALHAAPAGERIAVDTDGTAQALHDEPAAEAPLTKEQLALRLLILKVIEEKLAEVKGDHRAQGAALLHIGDQVAAYLDDDDAKAGRMLGRVGLSKPTQTWRVTDADAFTAWTQEHRPEEIETRPVVRNAFVTAALAAAKTRGGFLDEATGEITLPDGIELSVGSPTLTVKPSPEATDLVTAAITAGRLSLAADGTPSLPAGS